MFLLEVLPLNLFGVFLAAVILVIAITIKATITISRGRFERKV